MQGLLPVFRRFIGYVATGSRAWRRRAFPVPEDGVVRGEVVKSVDGDTLKIRDERDMICAVRLLSIDTPETHYFGLSQGYWGEAAAARLAELLPVGSSVEIRTDEQACDVHGRLLGYVYSGRKLINRILLQEGLAASYIIAPNLRFAKEFSEDARKAAAERRGMFGDPRVDLPYEFRWAARGGAHAQLVGSLSRGVVLRLEERERIPFWDRVFFFDRRDVKPPFALAPER